KTVLTDDGPLRLDIPRDRDGSFDPILIPKHERRFTGFDDKIIAMYARGMTLREIQAFLAEQYGTEVSPEFISSVTDAVMDEVTAWQARPLEVMYPVVFFDALRVKMREDGVVRNKAVYLALGVLPDGTRDILGLWIETTEGAKFWMKVFNDLKTRGTQDILIAVTDGLKGMEQALAAVFPNTTLQTCIVHLIRNSLEYANWKERRAVAAALKPVYTAPTVEAALAELAAFENGEWGRRYAPIGASWRRAWDQVIPFFTFPPAIRKIIYTTVFFDALRVKMREDGVVRNKAVYLALGVLPDGTRDILGLWIETTEGAKFWMKVFNDLKTRGTQDILIAVTDGLKGMEQALAAVFPNTTLQTCIVHLIRNSLEYANWKERRAVAAALKPVYTAPTVEAALAELAAFENGEWGRRYAPIGASWRRAWDQVIPFFTFPPAIRKIIYTTDEVDKRVVCFRSFMASVLVATERVPHLPAVALASSARTAVGKRAQLVRLPHAPDPGRTSDCRRRQTPCGYRDAQACLPAVPAHGSCAQSAPGDPRRRLRYA
ncbi:IS256 family transposase, partial [Cupriavidus taiwanensis]|uniref:IS256 family transposase n=4 Tax=Burkholderiaceae TaxID=119060 RepID=UPI0023F9EB9E